MDYVICPNDFAKTPIYDGLGVCPQCEQTLAVQAVAIRLGCDHQPRPVRGNYHMNGMPVPYEYCSAECKEEHEREYPGSIHR